MLPKPIKKLFFLLICGAAIYYGYQIVRVHGSHEVIALKQFATAIQKGDTYALRRIGYTPEVGLAPLRNTRKRDEVLAGHMRFNYFKVDKLENSPDGKLANIVATQIFRVDPPNEPITFLGTKEVENVISAQLVYSDKEQAWRVKQYQDTFMLP